MKTKVISLGRSMRTKLVLLLLIAAVIGAVGALGFRYTSQQQRLAELEASPDRGTVRWYAEVAKANGQTKVKLPAPQADYPGSTADYKLEQALSAYTLLVAEPIQEKTAIHDEDEIVTAYKFRTLEYLSPRRAPLCPMCPTVDVPSEFLPLKGGEFVVTKYGGSFQMEGVWIEMFDSHFPQFQVGNKYLLLTSLNPSGTADICGGSVGAFIVGGDDMIRPMNKNSHPVKEEIEKEFGNSLEILKRHLSRSSSVR